MLRKDLVSVAKAINEVLELEDDDAIDLELSPKDLEKELKQCVGGDSPELEIMYEDDFTPEVWKLLADLGNKTAIIKTQEDKPKKETKTRKKVAEPEPEPEEEEIGEEEEPEEEEIGEEEEPEEEEIGEEEEPEEEAPQPKPEPKKKEPKPKPEPKPKTKPEPKKKEPEPVEEEIGEEPEEEAPKKKRKASTEGRSTVVTRETPGKVKKRIDTVVEAIAEICPEGATVEEIYKRADEIYVESGGKANSIATNVTNNTLYALIYFGTLEKKGTKLTLVQ